MGLLLVKTFRSRFELCVVVESNVAKFLSSPSLGGRDRGDPREIHCKDTASQIPMMMPVESQQQRVHQAGGRCDLTVGYISLRRTVGRSKLHLCRVMARCQCCHLDSHELTILAAMVKNAVAAEPHDSVKCKSFFFGTS